MDRDEYYEIIHDLADEGAECYAIQDLANEMWKKINGYERRIAELKQKTRGTPKGDWLNKEGVYGVAYCSECLYELRGNNTNFCPNCGADMRGEDE